ncbi:MAG: hypothetical protein Q8P86_00295 [bacterium]|nr:hypothetical protein [bacterium]
MFLKRLIKNATSFSPEKSGRTSRALTFKRGIGLVEGIIYIAVLAILLGVVVSMLASILQSYRVVKLVRIIEQSASSSMERMVREIRDAKSIDGANSILGSHPGKLVILTTDETGGDQTVEFFIQDNVLRLKEDGVDKGPLTVASASVTNLIFREVDTGISKGVKIEMTVHASQGDRVRTDNFYGTAILKESY